MFKSATLTHENGNWYRLFCKEDKHLTLDFKDGVNVISSPNGKGKTTFLKAIESFIVDNDKPEGVYLSAGYSRSDKPNVFFFSTKDMNPELMMSKINPYKQNIGDISDSEQDMSAISEVAFWFERNSMSHGQCNNSFIEDIEEIVVNGTAGCVIIDEPEIAMDYNNLYKLIQMLKKHEDKSQFIIVSHHPWLVLNKDFNQINFDPNVNYQKEMISKQKSLNLLGE